MLIKSDIYRKSQKETKKNLIFLKKGVDVRLKIIKIRLRCHALKRTAAKTKRFEVL